MVAVGGCRCAWPGDPVDFQWTVQLLAWPFIVVRVCVLVLWPCRLKRFSLRRCLGTRASAKSSWKPAVLCGADLEFRCMRPNSSSVTGHQRQRENSELSSCAESVGPTPSGAWGMTPVRLPKVIWALHCMPYSHKADGVCMFESESGRCVAVHVASLDGNVLEWGMCASPHCALLQARG